MEMIDTETPLYWYTLRTLLDEEKCVSFLKEHIAHYKLNEKIQDIKFFKEYKIIETEELSPSSDLLPKRGFKSSKTSVWVKLSNGNYKRIKLVEKRPFKGMIFMKMEHDLDLFKMVRSWDTGFTWLGQPVPYPMTDFQLQKTEASLEKGVPCIVDYVNSKGYLLVEGSVASFKDVKVEPIQLPEEVSSSEVEEIPETVEEEVVVSDKAISQEQELAEKKAEIYSDLNIKEYEDAGFQMAPKFSKSKSKKSDQQFKTNDFVFISHLGFKGVVQEIDYDKGIAVVGVQMFGRRQPVECKISELSEI